MFYLAKVERQERFFSFFRFIFIIGSLAFLVSIFQKGTFDQKVFWTASVLFSWLLVTVGHDRLKRRCQFWKGVQHSCDLTRLRKRRDFSGLKLRSKLWDVSYQPANHPYAFDLDVVSELFPLLNTCTTKQGAEGLFKLLLKSPFHKKDHHLSSKIKVDPDIIHWLKDHGAALLRRMEVYRLLALETGPKPLLKKSRPSDTKINFSLFYGVFLIMAWAALVLPSFSWHELSSPPFLDRFSLYIVLTLLGTFLFQPTIARAQHVYAQLKPFIDFNKYLKETDNVLLEKFEFFHPKYKRLFAAFQLTLELLLMRGNPLFWLLVHAFLPFDALICLLLSFFERFFEKKTPPLDT